MQVQVGHRDNNGHMSMQAKAIATKADWAGSMNELTTIQSQSLTPNKKSSAPKSLAAYLNSIAYDALTAPAPFNAKDLLTARAVNSGSAHLKTYPQSSIHL